MFGGLVRDIAERSGLTPTPDRGADPETATAVDLAGLEISKDDFNKFVTAMGGLGATMAGVKGLMDIAMGGDPAKGMMNMVMAGVGASMATAQFRDKLWNTMVELDKIV